MNGPLHVVAPEQQAEGSHPERVNTRITFAKHRLDGWVAIKPIIFVTKKMKKASRLRHAFAVRVGAADRNSGAAELQFERATLGALLPCGIPLVRRMHRPVQPGSGRQSALRPSFLA